MRNDFGKWIFLIEHGMLIKMETNNLLALWVRKRVFCYLWALLYSMWYFSFLPFCLPFFRANQKSAWEQGLSNEVNYAIAHISLLLHHFNSARFSWRHMVYSRMLFIQEVRLNNLLLEGKYNGLHGPVLCLTDGNSRPHAPTYLFDLAPHHSGNSSEKLTYSVSFIMSVINVSCWEDFEHRQGQLNCRWRYAMNAICTVAVISSSWHSH